MDGRIRSDPIWSKIYMTCKIHPIYTHNVGNFENFGAISRFLNENHFMQNVLLPLETSIILYKYISLGPVLSLSLSLTHSISLADNKYSL